jgi:hypothetical protein
LTDGAARAQLISEARAHVLRFDWVEVARQTREVYGGLVHEAPHSAVSAAPES